MKQGVVVAMATHNAERFIERALASINDTFKGSDRQFALVIADDASSDRTLALARRFQSDAAYRLTLGFPKASCVGESKNRASMMARPFLQQFPWVLWMDDDDEMLPGRLKLIDKMEAHGQKAGVGNWVHSLDGGDRKEYITGDWSIANRAFSPCMTVIHRDLIPRDGRYFYHTPRDVHEDMVTHALMTLRGIPWCYHGGEDIHVYHRRSDSWSGVGARTAEMLKHSVEYMNQFTTQTNIASFCSIALGELATSELKLMLTSLRLHGNNQPVYVLTDTPGYSQIKAYDIPGVELIVDDSIEEKNSRFPNWREYYLAANLVPGAMLSKMQIIREALKNHQTTMFLDADQIVLRQIHEVIEEPVGLVHEGPNSMSWPIPPSEWPIQFLGCYNGGLNFFSRDGLEAVNWWEKDYLESYTWRGDDMKPHGGFSDQSSLEMFCTMSPIHAFHRGYGVSIYRLPRGDWPSVKESGAFSERTGIHGSHDLFFQGWPMMTIHQHFRGQFWNTDGRELFTTALSRSNQPTHNTILQLINEGQNSPLLSNRPKVRYRAEKVTA